MNTISISKDGKVTKTYRTDGTCLQDEITCSYSRLVKIFGLPNGEGDSYKVDVEWIIDTPYGVSTIYNYKDGKSYLGAKGLDFQDITNWHIGGKTLNVVKSIMKALMDTTT